MIVLFGVSVAIEKPDAIPTVEKVFYIFIAVRLAFEIYLNQIVWS